MEHKVSIRDYNAVANQLNIGNTKQKAMGKVIAQTVLNCLKLKKEYIVLDSDNKEHYNILKLVKRAKQIEQHKNNQHGTRQVKQFTKKKENKITELTPEQIENWRKVLSVKIGPYALIMPDRDLIVFANNMQNNIDKME